MIRRALLFSSVLCILCSVVHAADKKKEKSAKAAAEKSGAPRKIEVDKNTPVPLSSLGDFVEKDFPFFSSVLDARDVGEGFPKDNLTPRGIILNLGHNLWACFDTDLLRIACIWEGEEGKPPVTPEALAPGSYHIAGQKTKDGQDFLPKPVGKVWASSMILPGVAPATTDGRVFTDPRESGPSKNEPGKGALPPNYGSFKGLRIGNEGVLLEYAVLNASVKDWIHAELVGRERVVCRTLDVSATDQEVRFDMVSDGFPGKTTSESPADIGVGISHVFTSVISCPPGDMASRGFFGLDKGKHTRFAMFWGLEETSVVDVPRHLKLVPLFEAPRRLWPQTLTTKATLSTSKEAYVLDDIPLPLDNPWKRNVRLADIAFLDDKGDAAAVTFDGDVWLISGLTGDLNEVKWKRFASGLHEPMSIVARPTGSGTRSRNSSSSTATASGSSRDTNGDQRSRRL